MTDAEVPEKAAEPGLPEDRRGDLLFIVVTTAVLAVILAVNVLNVFHDRARSGHPVAFWEPVVWEGSSGLALLAVSPLILAMTRRFWPLDPPRLSKFAVHGVTGVAISLFHVLAIGALRWAAYRATGGAYDPLSPVADWPYELRKDLLVYAGLVAIYVVWRQLRAPAPRYAEAAPDVLEVRDGPRRHYVDLAEVVWVEAAGNYVELHRSGAGLLHRASLAAMESRLRAAGFVRIHRSRLVRRDAVAAVESRPTGDFLVRLRDGRELAGSRRYRRPLLAD